MDKTEQNTEQNKTFDIFAFDGTTHNAGAKSVNRNYRNNRKEYGYFICQGLPKSKSIMGQSLLCRCIFKEYCIFVNKSYNTNTPAPDNHRW